MFDHCTCSRCNKEYSSQYASREQYRCKKRRSINRRITRTVARSGGAVRCCCAHSVLHRRCAPRAAPNADTHR
jgi:hypothetical protein